MLHKMRSTIGLVCLLSTAAFAADDKAAPIVFSTAPTHSKAETVKLYTPLMNYLSQVTGRKFVIKPAANFIEYSVRMRLNKYDMLFDGPHLNGWRMVNMDHTPIVRFPGTIKIVVAADKRAKLTSLDDLKGGRARVCAFASPNMLTMAFLTYFPNPIQQPNLLRIQGFKGLVTCLKSGRGQAAVLRDKLWEKIKDEDKANMELIASPERGYPERTFSVSPKIDEALRKQITDAMLSEDGLKVSQALMARFKKKTLIAAKPSEYDELDLLLRPIWGFHSR